MSTTGRYCGAWQARIWGSSASWPMSIGNLSQKLQEVLPLCDLVVGTEEEINKSSAARRTRCKTLPCPLARKRLLCWSASAEPQGCAAFPGIIPDRLDGAVSVKGFPVEVYNVLGAGDAFMAGFLRGWLKDHPIERCCEWANACGAIVVSRHGCAPAMPTWSELQSFLATSSRPHRLRDDARIGAHSLGDDTARQV